MHSPTWVEDPSTPLRMIGAFLGEHGKSPQELIDRAATMREAARAQINSRLSGEPLAQLSALIDVARPHVSMSEGRARWQLTIIGSLRAHIAPLGRRLVAAGVLSEADDVFFLTPDEMVALAARPSPTRALVMDRKRELARSAEMQPPPFLGAAPDMQAMPPEVVSVFRRFFGLGVEPSKDNNVIRGNSGAPGKVRGRARVITELADSERLEPGDILVCTLTAPPWTPLFAIASAVVTDTGGVLSHSAICAREFAIPCVVGTQVGTRVIRDGAMITVDGDSGLVRLE